MQFVLTRLGCSILPALWLFSGLEFRLMAEELPLPTAGSISNAEQGSVEAKEKKEPIWLKPMPSIEADIDSELTDDDVLPADEQLMAEALGLTQQELRDSRRYSLGIGLGSVFAWQDLGLVWAKSSNDQDAWGVSLGQGSFDLNENNEAQTFWIETKVLSVYGFYRRYISDFPVFWQVSQGLAYWVGSIRPRGNDQGNLDERRSLISDFASISYNLSISLRLSWHWSNGVFIEFAPFQFAASYILQEDFTNNASTARETLRDEMEGPQSWSGVNLVIGYDF